MGNSEEAKPSGSEKSSSPALDQNNIHVYPDWATMQAFYGPRLAMPPYLNSTVAPPHTPLPYMWGPTQSMIPPYGAPYATFYAPGGVYAHPGIPLAGTALSMETPAKSSGNADGGLVKKLKELDGLAMSIGNGNSDSAERVTEQRQSDSDETGGSSDGSNRVTTPATQNGKKRSRQGSQNTGVGKGNWASEKIIDAIPLASTKMVENTNTALELKDSSLSLKSSPTGGPQLLSPNEAWLQNERQLKRERRKQSNRESARRSRLRKQAETEELATKVQALTAENMALTSEINKLMESSEKLKLENIALREKLRGAQVRQIDDGLKLKPVGTVNLLARVNNNNHNNNDIRNEDGDTYGDKNPGAKLHQLLDTNPRADTVAAG